MKKSIFYIVLLFSVVFRLGAQVNLVPNGSFEDTTQCPFSTAQIDFALPWVDPNHGSSDLFNSCASSTYVGVPVNIAGTQPARTGKGYAGLMTYAQGTNQREYIQVQLDSQLQVNKIYYVEFFVSMADTQTVAANNIGAYFSNIAVSGTSAQILNYTPQINNDPVTNPLISKTTWTKVSGGFTATGTERYMTIGNFLNDASTDTVYIGGGCSGCDAAYYYIDDIKVVCTDCDTSQGVSEMFINGGLFIYPNPAQNVLNINYNIPGTDNFTLKIYDFTGKLTHREDIRGNNGKITFNSELLTNGVYFVQIQGGSISLNEKFIKQ